MKKIIHARIVSYLDKNNLLGDFQHGFRKHRSTETALLIHKETILQAFTDKILLMGIYIDFSKAFDLVNHKILLAKLLAYGIRGIALELFESYLPHRAQYVELEREKSSLRAVRVGVPQGSILGPLLFIMFVNDMPASSVRAKFISYADDTAMFITATSETELQLQGNRALREFKDWADANCLRINASKTKVVVYMQRGKKL